VKNLKEEKLNLIRRNFKVPSLTTTTFRESNGFEVYRIRGLSDLENKVFIQPKLFLSTATDRGSILGFKTGEKNSKGEELVSISVPVALVNGLVDSLPITGGVSGNTSVGISMPDSYKIPNVDELKKAVGKDSLETLPVCPTSFKLSYKGREYRAENPFKDLSICPINQFFRISFKAPIHEMRALLEQAAVQTSSVLIVADLEVEFTIPKRSVEMEVKPELLKTNLDSALKSALNRSNGSAHGATYSVQDIEEAAIGALFETSRTIGVEPHHSTEMNHHVDEVINRFFDDPDTCSEGGVCRKLRSTIKGSQRVQYAWIEGENIASSLRTQATVTLGAVANSTKFTSIPTRSVLEAANRPPYFKGVQLTQIISDCGILMASNYQALPGMTPVPTTEIPFVKEYCNTITGYSIQTANLPQNDGYFPLGTNTTVYPGAIVKIDLESISEFTTAKTKQDSNGQWIIESEIIDMLATQPGVRGTVCTQGDNVSCIKYAEKQIEVRDQEGNHMQGSVPCTQGTPGCTCQTVDGKLECTKPGYLYQTVMDYDCDPKDERDLCPYHKEVDVAVDHEIEYDCQNIKVGSKTSFLCFGGCNETYELVCKEKSRKPIMGKKRELTCVEDNPKTGIVHRIKQCLKPQYVCSQWSVNCRQYSINESFQIVHEEVAPKWRPFAIEQGEYPRKFEDQIFLKFVSPKGTVTDCRLDKFARTFSGNTIYIKIPDETNSELPCGVPLWNAGNQQELYLPKVFIKNDIHYAENRLCGKTEYSMLTQNIPSLNQRNTVPPTFQTSTTVTMQPVAGSCRHDNPVRVGSDNWYLEVPPIRFSGRVSVLGRMLESIVSN
jgi:hypothetical protein